MDNLTTKEKALIIIAVNNLIEGLESADVSVYLETITQLTTITDKLRYVE